MTVGELVKNLGQYPDDTEIVVETQDEDGMDWYLIDETWFHEVDETCADATVAIRIPQKSYVRMEL